MLRDEAISVRCEGPLKKAVEAVAKSEGRTVSAYVARVLAEHLKAIGKLPEGS